MKKVSTIGNSKGKDAYHNEFLSTDSMLESNLRKNLVSKNIDTEDKVSSSDEETLRTFGMNSKIDEKLSKHIELLKDNMIYLYREYNFEKSFSLEIEKLIRRVEDIQFLLGSEPELFDPIKNKTGLGSGEALENADKVVSTTVSRYKMHSISSINSSIVDNVPVINIEIFGEEEGVGFEVFAKISSEEDFDGNEVIDYVFSKEGGVMSVKARNKGQWIDVSESYKISCNVKRYNLGDLPEDTYGLFMGEKLISQGKEKLIEALNLNDEDVKFGKCRVFSKNKEFIDRIRSVVRVNKL